MLPRTDDRRFLLFRLEDVARRHEWRCLAYCVMRTHYHVLLTTPQADLAKGMQRLNGLYAQYLNEIRGEHGHVFQGRYHSTLVEAEGHLLELFRYIALNPVRAGICERPAQWHWSSYAASAGLAPSRDLLALADVHRLFAKDRRRAEQRLRAFVEEGLAVSDLAGV